MHRPRRCVSEWPRRRHLLQQCLWNLRRPRRSLLRNRRGGLHRGWPRVQHRRHWQHLPALRQRECRVLRHRDEPSKPNLLSCQPALSDRRQRRPRLHGLWWPGPTLLRQRNGHRSLLFHREFGLSDHRWRWFRNGLHMPGLRRLDPVLLSESDLQRHPQLRGLWRGSDLPIGRPVTRTSCGNDGGWRVLSCHRLDTRCAIPSSKIKTRQSRTYATSTDSLGIAARGCYSIR